ncbi:hypothetical protein G9A89_018259 [Geosiphon pyriformis]|nr:hypothetical protein G9A89_018259 [Geosiphon pyriformis]
MDESLSGLGTVNIKAGAAVFFKNIDSQAVLDTCKLELDLVHLDFRNWYWIECCHIVNIIHHKNLNVNWYKIKDYLSVLDNKCVDELTRATAFYSWHLPHSINKCYLRVGGAVISGNSRHFFWDVFWSVHRAHWKIGSGLQVVMDSLHADINWFRLLLVWHPNFYMAAGFTSKWVAGFWTYFIKALYHQLSIAMCKQLYDKSYPSVVCLFCGDVKVSDHAFSCLFNADNYAWLLDTYVSAWGV